MCGAFHKQPQKAVKAHHPARDNRRASVHVGGACGGGACVLV